MKNVLFFGNSLTAGYGLNNAPAQSLPGLIQEKLDAVGIDVKVINAGKSGDTTRGGLVRIDRYLDTHVDVFVLELGINDVMRGISPQISLKNLQAIVDKVKAKFPEAKLVLLGMEIPSFIQGIFAEEFRSIFKKLAAANNMSFLPFLLAGVAGKKHLNLGDMIHPTAEGYKIIADNVWPLIQDALQEDQSLSSIF
jgi:acyl-CoA thioesterase-1